MILMASPPQPPPPQRCYPHHPVQHPLLHEREALALDEGLLQDQAAAEECGDGEGAGQHEGGL